MKAHGADAAHLLEQHLDEVRKLMAGSLAETPLQVRFEFEDGVQSVFDAGREVLVAPQAAAHGPVLCLYVLEENLLKKVNVEFI